jgi:uncharacterized metal-binding protein YceD (DUF177 family)
MKINLSKIPATGLIINEDLELDKSLYENSSLLGIKWLHVEGIVNYDYENNLCLNLNVDGVFILSDAITLDPIDYKFSCSIDEIINDIATTCGQFYEKSKNTLDISEILWENIVLEIPIRAANSSSDEITISGNGWELVNENVKKIDPRLAKLTELLEEGKE